MFVTAVYLLFESGAEIQRDYLSFSLLVRLLIGKLSAINLKNNEFHCSYLLLQSTVKIPVFYIIPFSVSTYSTCRANNGRPEMIKNICDKHFRPSAQIFIMPVV